MSRIMKKVFFLVTSIILFTQTSVLASAPELSDEIKAQLGPVESIADDILAVFMWLIWIAAPLLIIWQLILYGKSSDAGDRRDHRRNIGIIIACTVVSQLVIWLIRDYLLPKF